MVRSEMIMDSPTAETRFWDKVDKTPTCWNWTGAKHRGYGQFTVFGWKRPDGEWRCKTVRAHRYAYETVFGPIPPGLTIEHECKNHSCVRPGPGHCIPLSRGENNLRGDSPWALNKRKTHCIRGHALVESNIIRRPSRPMNRECRTCVDVRKSLSEAR